MQAGREPAGPAHVKDLGVALRRQWARLDVAACAAAACLQLVMFSRWRSLNECAAEAANFLTVLALLALHSGGAGARLRRRFPALRELLVLSIRFVGLVLVPNTMDTLGVMQQDLRRPAAAAAAAGVSVAGGGGAAAAAAGHGSWALSVASLGSHVRSGMLLALAVCNVHACIGAAIGWQLPPVLHAVVHTSCVASLFWRAPRVCKQFVESHPHNADVAGAAYWVLQQLTSLLCLGSREALHAAAEASSDCAKCTAVAWALQLSLGLALPTLLIWRAQLNAAHDWAARQQSTSQQQEEQQQQQQRSGRGARTFDPARLAARAAVRESQWGQVCEPVLQAAAACPGGWLVALPATALLAFVVAVVSLVSLPGLAGRCG